MHVRHGPGDHFSLGDFFGGIFGGLAQHAAVGGLAGQSHAFGHAHASEQAGMKDLRKACQCPMPPHAADQWDAPQPGVPPRRIRCLYATASASP
jgi:hypothetical protein